MPALTQTALLLILSNVFMTFAWYGHLKGMNAKPLWLVVMFSWGIAFFEYCFQVPANRIGHLSGVDASKLKILQEGITLVVFVFFAMFWLKEPPRWNYVVAFALLVCAVAVAFLPQAKVSG